jgi:uncharacterized protein
MKKSAPDELELRSPIPFVPASNGEHWPKEPDERDLRALKLFRQMVDDRTRKLGVSRRDFITSTAGTACALAVMNQVYGCGGEDGPGYAIDAGATIDSAQACEALSSDPFIFDVQTHHVNPVGDWRDKSPLWVGFFESVPQASCGAMPRLTCLDTNHYLREMFVNSDTHVAVLSAVPAEPGADPLTSDEQRATRELIETLSGSPRIVTHGLVLPERGASQLDGMQRLAENLEIAAWKVYTPYGNWRLDDEAIAGPFYEKARSLGVKLVCAHKGLPLPGFDPAFAGPDDVGPAAKANPDLKFLIYHSAYETATVEGAYNPTEANPKGVNRLVRTVLEHGVNDGGGPRNVYAELGSTWRNVMTDMVQAAHVLGKLLKYVGEDRVVWGTDSIFYGSPQDQIAALKTFQIPAKMQEEFGYPALTDAVRAKIFGLNAAEAYGIDPEATRCAISEDDLAALRAQARAEGVVRAPSAGPSSRREFLAFLRHEKV